MVCSYGLGSGQLLSQGNIMPSASRREYRFQVLKFNVKAGLARNRAFIARIDVDVVEEQATLASPWRQIRDAAAYVRNDRTGQLSAAGTRSKTARRGSKANPGLVLRSRVRI